MVTKVWPAGLRGNAGEILRDGSAHLPPDNILRSEMEDGVKTRRKSTRGWSGFSGSWRFTFDEFAQFEDWVETELKDGIHFWKFNHPLRPYFVRAKFVPQDGGRPFAMSPAPGANLIVSFELEFLDRAIS